MILATGEALRWLGRRKDHAGLVEAGDRVEKAVRTVLGRGAPLPADLVGAEKAARTSDVSSAVLAEL
jgi:3-isopropylmalate dehydrogenase